MAVPDSKYTYYSPRKVLRFETGEVGAGANSSAQHVHPHSTVEALDMQFVDKQVYGHSSVLSAKTEPMNKQRDFLPQVRIGVVGDYQWQHADRVELFQAEKLIVGSSPVQRCRSQ